jgi:hypothetical protein
MSGLANKPLWFWFAVGVITFIVIVYLLSQTL